MRMMQVARDEIVDVVAVGDGLVPAPGCVNVSLRMTRAAVRRRAGGRVGGANVEHALIDVAVVCVMQVAVVQIVDVVSVFDRLVAAVGAVNVLVMLVGGVIHGVFLPLGETTVGGSPAWSSAAHISSRTCPSASE
jgi:hypothetical protein